MVAQLSLALESWLVRWLVPLLEIIHYGALPCVWAETLLFWMLGLDVSTSFRMFPRADLFTADYPLAAIGMAYAFALILVSWIPGYVRILEEKHRQLFHFHVQYTPVTSSLRMPCATVPISSLFAISYLHSRSVSTEASIGDKETGKPLLTVFDEADHQRQLAMFS
ncbi:flavohemoglobin [Purpureocillium lavendulum]|uniref:Flavohemoglobin n=1 Tax=Purpureocillium lavendulum TaxID=1247861 RepID=A0AB34FIE7_9HYPO|nr:flavohemoglobin [Purpureocillium lavendulum]